MINMLQLNPSIPVDTPKGPGLAIFVTWLNEEHHILWTVIQDETGEIWTWENPNIRGQKNIQMGRIIDNSKLKGDLKPPQNIPSQCNCGRISNAPSNAPSNALWGDSYDRTFRDEF